MRFSTKGMLTAALVHSALRKGTAWTGSQSLAQIRRSTGLMALSNEAQGKYDELYTSVDITESIRHESEKEMKKVAELFTPLQSSPILIQTEDELTSYMNSNQIQNYLFDCDGVLYRGTDSMPSASQTIRSLLENGKRVFFVTNNAASSRMELKQKLEKVLGLPKDTLEEKMMIGAAYVASRYLRSRLLNENNNSPRVHVIGTPGLCQEIQSAGFDISGGPDSIETPSGMSRDELASYPFPEGEIDAMVVGLDNDFNYRKLCIATVLLQRNPNAILVATNRDAYDLVGYDARHLPGNGALVSAVEAASGRNAINVGKPSSVLADWIMEEYNLDAEETMMVGDRLDTDVKFGNIGGMKSSALVLTGCTTVKEIERLILERENDVEGKECQDMMPTVIFPHVGYMMAESD